MVAVVAAASGGEGLRALAGTGSGEGGGLFKRIAQALFAATPRPLLRLNAGVQRNASHSACIYLSGCLY
jgi:hypothetical protein